MNRRQSFQLLAGTAATGLAGRSALAQQPAAPQPAPAFTLPPLGYAYEALEPHIDAATMGYHHKNHHNAFIGILNAQVEKFPDLAKKPIVEFLSNLAAVPEAVRTPVRNAGGGHWNHTYFWNLMTPGGAKAPTADVKSAIDAAFGSFEKMQEAVNQAAMTRFGSGWAWLCKQADGSVQICSTPNQDNPLMPDSGCKGFPVLGLDVWEHAYYLKYQNRRPDYVAAFFNLINWDEVNRRFAAATPA